MLVKHSPFFKCENGKKNSKAIGIGSSRGYSTTPAFFFVISLQRKTRGFGLNFIEIMKETLEGLDWSCSSSGGLSLWVIVCMW